MRLNNVMSSPVSLHASLFPFSADDDDPQCRESIVIDHWRILPAARNQKEVIIINKTGGCGMWKMQN
jgi:hypothetical protein